MSFNSLALAGLTMLATTTFVQADGYGKAPAVTGQLKGETYLMDTQKMTLYTFDKDSKGTSNCYDGCAVKWPPLLSTSGAALGKGYSLVKRKDGTLQVAYNNQPLYLWFKDAKPGDMTGDGVGGVWHVARP